VPCVGIYVSPSLIDSSSRVCLYDRCRESRPMRRCKSSRYSASSCAPETGRYIGLVLVRYRSWVPWESMPNTTRGDLVQVEPAWNSPSKNVQDTVCCSKLIPGDRRPVSSLSKERPHKFGSVLVRLKVSVHGACRQGRGIRHAKCLRRRRTKM
jgi:hypothetical protein